VFSSIRDFVILCGQVAFGEKSRFFEGETMTLELLMRSRTGAAPNARD
jgi:hypothetical protein